MKRTAFKRGNKYHAKKTKPIWSDRCFDSAGEAERAGQLRLLVMAGEIADLQMQKSVHVCAGVCWNVDFMYREVETGEVWIEEFKGVEDNRYRVIKKLWAVYGEHPLKITKKVSGKIKVVETIYPERLMNVAGLATAGNDLSLLAKKIRKNAAAGKGTVVAPELAGYVVQGLEAILEGSIGTNA